MNLARSSCFRQRLSFRFEARPAQVSAHLSVVRAPIHHEHRLQTANKLEVAAAGEGNKLQMVMIAVSTVGIIAAKLARYSLDPAVDFVSAHPVHAQRVIPTRLRPSRHQFASPLCSRPTVAIGAALSKRVVGARD